MRRACAVVLLLLALNVPAAAAITPGDVAERVADRVMSPFCPGLTLSACPSAEATKLRARIEQWARHGLDETRIMHRLADEYGPGVRAVPSARGSGLLAWLLPAAFLVAAVALLVVTIRRWTRAPVPEAPRVDAARRARVEDELARLRAHPEARQ